MPDLSPDQAIEKLRGLPEDRQRAVLAKLSPEVKQSILGQLKAPKAQAEPQQQPGFFKRAGEGIGVPTSREQVKAMVPTPEESELYAVFGPELAAGKALAAYGHGVADQAKKSFAEIKEAGENIDQGDKSSKTLVENWGKAFAATSDLFWTALGPVGGGVIKAWGEDIHQGNKAGAAGDAVAALVNAALFKGASPLGAEGKANKIAFAADIKKGINEVKTVLPDIQKASKGAPPLTLEDLATTVNDAKRNMNTEAGLAMQPIKGQQLIPNQIAGRIKSRITPDMMQTAEGRQVQTMFQKASLDFQKPWTFEELDALRMRWNSELSGYWKMSAAEKTSYLKAHPEVAVQAEVVDAIKDIVYPAMDRAAGKPPGYFGALKGRQSTLIDLQKALETQVDELATKSGKIKGAPRMGAENVSAYGHPTGTPGISFHRLQNLVHRPDPLGAANAAVKRAFSGRPSAKGALASYPVRQLFIDLGEKPSKKKPAEQIRDLKEMTGTNPAMPVGPER